jgi:hypothetical protein
MSLSRLATVVVLALALLLPPSVMHAAQNATCSFNTFSAPTGYTLSLVNGLSDDGTVVGQLVNNKTQQWVAFTYSESGVFTEYSAPKSASTWLYGGNASGENAGTYQDLSYPQAMHGFLLQGAKFTAVNYPKAANTWLFDINQVGAVVGSYSASPSLTKGFMLVNGKYTAIAYPKAQLTYATAISDNGVVAGTYASGFVFSGFTWQDGTFTVIDYPKATYGTSMVGVNNSGVAVGNHFSAEDSFGFIYENGVFKNIVYSGAKYTSAGGINNNGLVSGQIFLSGGKTLGYTASCN